MMKENVIRNEHIFVWSALTISLTYLFCRADGDLTYAVRLLLQCLIPIASAGLFYIAWKKYQDRESSFEIVMLVSALAMLVALLDMSHLNEVIGRCKIFVFMISPILMAEAAQAVLKKSVKSWKILVGVETGIGFIVINLIYTTLLDTNLLEEPVMPMVLTVLGGVWAWILNYPERKRKKKKMLMVVWSSWFGLFAALTVFLAAMWKNGYWTFFHLGGLNVILLVWFPVVCMVMMRWLQTLRFETPSMGVLAGAGLYLGLILFVMWTDHGIRTIYMCEEQMNADRSVYYLMMANLIALSMGTKKQKICRAGILNIGVLMLSPLLKEVEMLMNFVSAAYPWAAEARYYNSMVFISETYGMFSMILLIGLSVLICAALVSKKGLDNHQNVLLRFLAAGYGIRMVLALIQWWLKFPHVQIPFPFCGTAVLDLAVLWILSREYFRKNMTKGEAEDEKIIRLFE